MEAPMTCLTPGEVGLYEEDYADQSVPDLMEYLAVEHEQAYKHYLNLRGLAENRVDLAGSSLTVHVEDMSLELPVTALRDELFEPTRLLVALRSAQHSALVDRLDRIRTISGLLHQRLAAAQVSTPADNHDIQDIEEDDGEEHELAAAPAATAVPRAPEPPVAPGDDDVYA